MRYWALVVTMFWTGLLLAADAPDSGALWEEAKTSPLRTLYRTGFEEKKPPNMEHYYAGKVPSKVLFNGVTDEVAHSGKRAYKVQVTFEAGRWGNAYFKLPFDIPQWSDLHAKFYVKIDSLPKTWAFHGFVGAQARHGIGHNNINGEKKGEDNGWELWEVTATRTSDVGDYVMGIGLRIQLPDHSPEMTLTMYLDDVEVHGKLPSNYERKWADVHQYFTVDREKIMREQGAQRYGDMAAWLNRLNRQYRKEVLPPGAPAMLKQYYDALTQRIEADLATASLLVEQIKVNLDDTEGMFTADLDKPERLLSHLGMWIDAAHGYMAYASKFGEYAITTFVLEPTRSYAILPDGPTAHNWETTHYSWSGRGFEHPQMLPGAKVIPAVPARLMTSFGCRGTIVPLSFAVSSESRLTDLTVEASDLRFGNHMITEQDIDVRIVAPWYRPMGQDDGTQVPELKNEMLLHDPVFVVPAEVTIENVYKDARFGSDAAVLQPVTIPAGQMRQFYITVNIPDDAVAGTYRGNVKMLANDMAVVMDVQIEVLPFDLEPTPMAYSFFYRAYLRSEEEKEEQGIHPWYKTKMQMQAELINMAQHGCNTLNMYDGTPTRVEDGWDFAPLDRVLSMAKKAGLTRSPFTWLGSGLYYIPYTRGDRPGVPDTMAKVMDTIRRYVPAVNRFCDEGGYPRPAYFGHDEASGEKLMKLHRAYSAVNQSGGIVTAACYPSYFDEIGEAMSLPIIYGGAQSGAGARNMKRSQSLGYETWIYNCPATNMPASASVYRRRYGLMMWRNGENGCVPWEYQGLDRRDRELQYNNNFEDPTYAMAYPVMQGDPIDTIHYEAFREGVYDTRYMATLQKHLAKAKATGANQNMIARIEKWLATFSVNDDLQQVRHQMAEFTVALGAVH